MSIDAEGERKQQRRDEAVRQLQEMKKADAKREERAAAKRERERERQAHRRAQQEERVRQAMQDGFENPDDDEYDPYSDPEYLETLNYLYGGDPKLRF